VDDGELLKTGAPNPFLVAIAAHPLRKTIGMPPESDSNEGRQVKLKADPQTKLHLAWRS
jgi:hypothetical protein